MDKLMDTSIFQFPTINPRSENRGVGDGGWNGRI